MFLFFIDQCEAVQCPGGGFQAKDCKCYCASEDPNNPLGECDDKDVVTNKPRPTTTKKKGSSTESPVTSRCLPDDTHYPHAKGHVSQFLIQNSPESFLTFI